MKIVCDSCGAKYSIADEKVRGKVFKIRCKKCSDVIVVKGQSGDEPAADGVQDEPVEGNAVDTGYEGGSGVSEWYAVVDGDQVGPITPDEIESYYNQGTLDDSSYAWREGLEDWQRLDALDEFRHLTVEAAGPKDETVVAAPGEESGGGADVTTADEQTVVTEPGQFDFDAPNDEVAEGGDFSGPSGGDEDGSPSVDVSDDLAGEFAGEVAAEQTTDSNATVGDPGVPRDAVGGEPSGGGEPGPGGDLDAGFTGKGGFEAQSDGGAGEFSAEESVGSGDEGSFESFGEDSTQSGVSGTSNQSVDGGQEEQGPEMSSDDMVEQRSENSVLFSLSSVDDMKAVDGSEGEEDVSGSGASTEGSGLIDIQNLASSHAAMSSEEEEADGGGAPVEEAGSSPSPSPGAANNQQLSNDSVNMPSLAPSGSRGSNTGLIIAVIIGGFILLSAVVVATVLYLNRGKQTKKIVEKKTKAAASATESPTETSEDETSDKGNKGAESDDGDKEEAEAEKKKAEESDEESAEEEKKKADKQDEETDESEDESSSEEKTKVASNDNSASGGGSEGRDRGRTGSAARTGDDNSGGGGGGDGGGDDESVDELLDNVDDDDESSGGGGGAPEKELEDKPTRSMVKSTIGKYSSRISTCASEKNRNDLSGTLFIKFQIKPAGRVSSASIRTSKFKGTDVGKCVQRVVSSMKFPETKNGMPVKFPFKVE